MAAPQSISSVSSAFFDSQAAHSIPERTASAGRDRLRSRNLLIVVQVAMALVLLVSALLMIRTFPR
jgi:hypothetical protein